MLCNGDLTRLWLKQETGLNHIKESSFIYLYMCACIPGFPLTPVFWKELVWSWKSGLCMKDTWCGVKGFFYFLFFKYIVAFWLRCSPVIYNCFSWLSLLWNIRKNPQHHWSMYSVHFSYVIVSLLKSFFESFESIVKYIHIQAINSWSNNLL